MAAAAEAEMLQPWRRSFPLCRPYTAHSKEDAARFLREFAEGADSIDVDSDARLVPPGNNSKTASQRAESEMYMNGGCVLPLLLHVTTYVRIGRREDTAARR